MREVKVWGGIGEKKSNKQLKRWRKNYDRNNATKRPNTDSQTKTRLANRKIRQAQPTTRTNRKQTNRLLEKTTRSRQNKPTSSKGTRSKPRIPEPLPNTTGHILERTIMNGRYEYDITNRLLKKDGNYLARLTDKEAHRIIDELNRQDRKLNEYERTIAKIRKILKS